MDDIARRQAMVDPLNSCASLLVGEELRTGRLNHRCVSASVVTMVMSINQKLGVITADRFDGRYNFFR